ncbi:CsbD family protein [Gordonia neofelifaecis]|uniref:CsbD family protein n=1 Tax=Gordonia neofelifaecis NRRL B-59395 TaxID=644548 RepID=F1YK99_9ACTN|nr:CsbD family protein [Gordonia neofelifaecis]EGD54945.1 CsbD family protein [Gordonia neofelifaecis NRRL B-59395]
MAMEDKISNEVEDLKGKAKETGGSLTGDDDLKNEGKADQASAAVKKGIEEVKDAVTTVKDKLTGDR